jgi:hypothetical protein
MVRFESQLFFPADQDVHQWFEDTGLHWPSEMRQLVMDVLPTVPRRAIVKTDLEAHKLHASALVALDEHNRPPKLFVQAGRLVYIAEDEEGRPKVSRITTTRMYERLSLVAEWQTRDARGVLHIGRPDRAVAGVLVESMEGWPFPPLSGVVEVPVFRADGSLLRRSGYDRPTGLVYRPAPFLRVTVPEDPSPPEVAEAVRALREPFRDLPFVSEADFANTLALMLTPIVRPMLGGGFVPIAAVSAPMPRTGKGLLMETVHYIVTGRWPALAGELSTADEWRKQLTTYLLAGNTFIIFDNLNRKLDSGELARAVTTAYWKDRPLGASEDAEIPVRCTWVVAGNNLMMSKEIAGRAYLIELDARTERPQDRRFNRNLSEWVPQHRAELLSALLTLVQAWVAARRPAAEVRPFGRFETWTEVVGSILAHAGVEGFLENTEVVRERVEDDEAEEWVALVDRLSDLFGSDFFSLKEVRASGERFVGLWPGGLDPSEKNFGHKLGCEFRRKQNVMFPNGMRLEPGTKSADGMRYRIREG